MSKPNSNSELIVSSSTDNLSVIRDFIRNAAENAGLSNEAIGKITLAVDEACTNVIKHAYNYSPDGEINIAANVKKSKFIISITDFGKSFNPEAIPDPNLKESIKQKRVGGLGMFLMKKLMDEVEYHTSSGKKNQVILVKYLA
ncbi:MAG: serine-protein kinase RsbW [Melioribacteraceae bacterium]|nr:MAG: serine-protein kinase RsbW [Melioribacteraceae bacterium]